MYVSNTQIKLDKTKKVLRGKNFLKTGKIMLVIR